MKQPAIAKLNHLHIAPRKVRTVANLIKGLRVNEAEAQLISINRRPAPELLKLLRSAVANARNIEKGINTDHLFVFNIKVDSGPMMKRLMARAMGRGYMIQKKMSHVTIALNDNKDQKASRFNFTKTAKKKSVKTENKAVKKTKVKSEKTKNEEKPGAVKRFFQRKSA
jgi:large subunit ribosomal protein L22